MRNLVKRYVAAMIRDAKTEEGLTEENFKVTTFICVTKRWILQSVEAGQPILTQSWKWGPCVLSKPFCLLFFFLIQALLNFFFLSGKISFQNTLHSNRLNLKDRGDLFGQRKS